MDQEKKNRLLVNLGRLVDSDMESRHIIKQSLALQIPSRHRFLFLLLFFAVFFAIQYYILIKSGKIIEKFAGLLGNVNDIVVPTFAVIITGYAIFQALVNGPTLISLITISESDKSKFEEYNLYFLGISMLYLFLIILNLLLMFFFNVVPKNWSLPLIPGYINEIIASVLWTVYLTFLINSLIELKSFVYNLFQCFRINAIASGVDFLKQEKDKSEKDK
ncbi:hypothetical protein BAMA_18455 [Bacillus manliponensis]|uniref:Uncharacterized protein n=1 Tax=Bacillus manliponensis TaxID=574376 RepID=A0A073K4C2_9BACI|nr:hypothetical protein [Bacillus manliponensis]KEK17123.1 hypothetical protein BAMA_18455 [Bacillus manliponensis]